MKNRGPILLVFGASLVLSPLAIRFAAEYDAAQDDTSVFQTIGATAAACDAKSIDTPRRRLGCNPDANRAQTRHVGAGGAVFVAARQ